MATNRLFIYDPETKRAAFLAKGYATGWVRRSRGDGDENLNAFFEKAQEFTGDLSKENPTRYELRTEDNLPWGYVTIEGWAFDERPSEDDES